MASTSQLLNGFGSNFQDIFHMILRCVSSIYSFLTALVQYKFCPSPLLRFKFLSCQVHKYWFQSINNSLFSCGGSVNFLRYFGNEIMYICIEIESCCFLEKNVQGHLHPTKTFFFTPCTYALIYALRFCRCNKYLFHT